MRLLKRDPYGPCTIIFKPLTCYKKFIYKKYNTQAFLQLYYRKPHFFKILACPFLKGNEDSYSYGVNFWLLLRSH
jgi:hypothetical protein